MYEYNATVVRVVDGDTIHADIDLGCDVHIDMTIRLLGINAPEMSTKEGQEAKKALEWFLPVNASFVLHTYKDKKEKYGRYLGVIMINGNNINQKMIDEGHAVSYP